MNELDTDLDSEKLQKLERKYKIVQNLSKRYSPSQFAGSLETTM